MSVAFWLALAMTPGMGDVTMKKIFTAYPNLNEQTWQQAAHLTKKLPTAEQLTRQLHQAQSHIKHHVESDIHILTIASSLYPPQLRLIPNPPTVLYIKGNSELLQTNMVAIIGTRSPTEQALQATHYVSNQFIRLGYTIVSGLALGIDTAAHEAAKGQTIAVMAGGLDQIYPTQNKLLAESIVANGGLLLSAMPMYTKITRGHFAARDRIQSGLAWGVCPVQGTPSSGTLHAVKAAIQYDRLLCYPKQDQLASTVSVEQLLKQAIAETKQTSVIELRTDNDLEIAHSQMEQLKKILV